MPYSVSLDNALAAMMICHFVISPGLASHQSQVCAASSFNVNTSLQLISVNYGGDSLTAEAALLKIQSGGCWWPAARHGNPFHNTLSFSPPLPLLLVTRRLKSEICATLKTQILGTLLHSLYDDCCMSLLSVELIL